MTLRTIQSAAIVVFFVLMMGLLWRDEIGPRLANRVPGIEINRAVLTDTWVNSDEWNQLLLAGRPIGVVRTIAEFDEQQGMYFNHSMMELNVGLVSARFLSTARMNRRLELMDGRVRAQFGALGRPVDSFADIDAEEVGPDVLDGRLRVDDRVMRIAVRRGDAVRFLQQRLLEPITLADNLSPVLRGDMLQRDVVYTTEVFDPLLGTASRIQVVWVGEETRVFNDAVLTDRVVEIRAPNITMTLVVDAGGTIQRREVPLLMGNISAADSAARIVFQRIAPADAAAEFPQFLYNPPERMVTQEEVVGVDRGEVTEGAGLISIMSGAFLRR